MTPPEKPKPAKVPLGSKVAYGAAGPVDIWCTWVPLGMANQVFNMTLGLSPILVSMAFAIFRLYDAIIDPLMGWISDNTRTRWGRRKPYILVGAILTGLCFPLIWMVGRDWSPAAMTAWLIVTGILFYTCTTLWNMPYQSMLLEMTTDYNERTTITSFRAFFQNFSTIVATWVWAITQLPYFMDTETGKPDTLAGIRTVAVAMGIMVIVLGLLPLLVKARADAAPLSATKTRLRESFRKTMSHKPFLIILAFAVLFSFGGSMVGSFNVYVSTYYVYGGDQAGASIINGLSGTIGLFLSIGSLPLFNLLSRRIGKTRTLFICVGIQILSTATKWWTYTPDFPELIIVANSLMYISNAGLWVMLPSMMADSVDADELKTGERREGSFASVFSWILKVSMTAGLALSGPLLAITGFDVKVGPVQPEDVLTRMRLIMTVLPSVMLVFAALVLMRYPLGPSRMAEIRTQLDERKENTDDRQPA